MRHIAKRIAETKGQMARAAGRAACIGVACLPLAACVGGGLDFASGVDRSIATGAIAARPAETSDEATVRNAVSSADLASLKDRPVPWANASSGSAGVISAIREQRADGVVCRSFTTTRHSYEGIARFDGRACQAGKGEWLLSRFERQG
ncbi:RT0821/Lpp0805 family surface protein [Ensifer soli]|uniref:RT0821/Lpp0805 family surface protein n=1 Tax=Ciceribacter sp. sgz301302 TaxID=3342379 RepID=UPI0035BB5044